MASNPPAIESITAHDLIRFEFQHQITKNSSVLDKFDVLSKY